MEKDNQRARARFYTPSGLHPVQPVDRPTPDKRRALKDGPKDLSESFPQDALHLQDNPVMGEKSALTG